MKRISEKLDLMAERLSKVAYTSQPWVVHRLALYAFTKAAVIICGRGTSMEEIKSLLDTVSPGYRHVAEELYREFALDLLKELIEIEGKPVMLDEARVEELISYLKREIKRIDTVVVVDGMSTPEFLTLAAVLRARGRGASFLERVFANPAGLTRFVTEQVSCQKGVAKAFLRDYARLLAEKLGASSHFKLSTVDLAVHERGTTLEDFALALATNRFFNEIEEKIGYSSAIVTSDHGYDFIIEDQGVWLSHMVKTTCYGASLSRLSFLLYISRG